MVGDSVVLANWDGRDRNNCSSGRSEAVVIQTAPGEHASDRLPRLASVTVSANGKASGSRRYEILEQDLQNPLQALADAVFVVTLCVSLGSILNWVNLGQLTFTLRQFWCSLAIALIYVVVERARVRDNGIATTDRRSRVVDVMSVWTGAFAGLIFINFALRSNVELSRVLLGVLYLGGMLPLMMWRAYSPPILARLYNRSVRARVDWVVIGDRGSSSLHEITDELSTGASNAASMISLDAHCSEERWPLEQQMVLSTACRALRASPKGAIYLCAAGIPSHRLASLCSSLSILPVGTYIIPDNTTAGWVGCAPRMVGRHLALELRRPPMDNLQRAAKRLMDIGLGIVALVLLSPLFLAVAIAIRADSRGPIFFKQYRTGQGGKQFRIFKFRSMYVMEDGPSIQQARRNDPRVTRIGRFLRASSIDELPQLFNVLKGEMSLVGPRPHAVAHDQHFSKLVDNYELRQHVKPGITGWAQALGYRGETTAIELMRKRIEHDIWYAQNASIALDIEIIARTVIELFRTRNAY